MRLVSPVDCLASLLAELRLAEKSEYSARDYVALVLSAAELKGYVGTVSRILEGLPGVDTLFLNLKPRNTLEDLEEVFRSFVSPLVGDAEAQASSPQNYTVAIDITHQPYYGLEPNEWVYG